MDREDTEIAEKIITKINAIKKDEEGTYDDPYSHIVCLLDEEGMWGKINASENSDKEFNSILRIILNVVESDGIPSELRGWFSWITTMGMYIWLGHEKFEMVFSHLIYLEH